MVSKVDKIIDWLKLDEGFDRNIIQLGNFNETKLASVVIILIGGFLIIDYLPSFLHYLYTSFKIEARSNNLEGILWGEQEVDYFDWGISAMNLILGYLLIINHSLLSKKLGKLTATNTYGSEEE